VVQLQQFGIFLQRQTARAITWFDACKDRTIVEIDFMFNALLPTRGQDVFTSLCYSRDRTIVFKYTKTIWRNKNVRFDTRLLFGIRMLNLQSGSHVFYVRHLSNTKTAHNDILLCFCVLSDGACEVVMSQ